MVLLEVFPNWQTSGIFKYMTDVPWDVSKSSQLDLEYFGNHSGAKTISPLVHRLLNSQGELPIDVIKLLANMISDKYRIGWQMLWQSLQNESAYVPYENYDMHEESHKTSTGADTANGADNTNHGKTSDTNLYHYGFNSTDKQPSGAETTSEGGSTNVAHNNSETHNSEENGTLHRHGNIGVTTNQQMIESEIELRKKNFFEIVYSDVDSVLALKIYDLCKGGR